MLRSYVLRLKFLQSQPQNFLGFTAHPLDVTPLGRDWNGYEKSKFGYQVSNKFQLRAVSGISPPESPCITGKVIHRHQGFEYMSTTTLIFPRPQNISAFWSCDELQIDQWPTILSFRLARTTADLIPYPFGLGIEEQILVLPGWIQVPVPALPQGKENVGAFVVEIIYCTFEQIISQKLSQNVKFHPAKLSAADKDGYSRAIWWLFLQCFEWMINLWDWVSFLYHLLTLMWTNAN